MYTIEVCTNKENHKKANSKNGLTTQLKIEK